MTKPAPKKPGRPALPPDQAQTAMIRERVTPAQRSKYEALGGKDWLVAALRVNVRRRECNACEWVGDKSDCVWCGEVGPLCPKCHETTMEA